ncbi:MAG: thioredoxin domain-containing protein [Betaproteobacteria bacterium]
MIKSLGRVWLSAGLLAGVFGVGTFSLQENVANAQPTVASAALARFGSPTTGPADAKVHIVEFLDPACEGCRAFYPIVKAVLAEYRGKVRLTVRHLAFHKGADYVVRVMEASRKQGKYWEVLETLFATQSTWAVNHAVQPARVLESLKGLGLDMPKLQRDMEAPEITQLMAQDLADAKTLKVAQTPDFFVNGKRLEQFGVDQFRTLVRNEVSAAYR